MKDSLREILADSHVCAVAIAVLLFWSLDSAFWALWGPLTSAAQFLFTAVAILDIPYISRTLTITDQLTVFVWFLNLFNSLIYLAAASILSHSVYGTGPLRALCKYSTKLARGRHA